MAPLKYGDFARNTNDLFSNDFCFDRKIKVKTKTANGVAITSEGSLKANSNFPAGKVTTAFTLAPGLNINKLGVTHDGRFICDAGYQGLVPGLSLSSLVEEGGKGPSIGELGLTYKHSLFTGTVKVDALNGPAMKETASVQYEKFHVGGELKANTGLDKGKGFAVQDYNVGVAFKDADFIASLSTKKKLTELNFSVHHMVNKDVQVGASYDHGSKKLLQVGGIYKVDPVTSFQGKIDSTGVLAVNCHQRVSKSTKLIASAQLDTTTMSAESHKFGLQLILS